MTDEQKTFKVTDRRHGSTAHEEEAETPVAGVSEAAAEEPTAATDRPARAIPPATLTGFIMSLGAQASMLLGGVEGAQPDLDGAKWLISILEMLREKTEGRRTSEETDALAAILYELRMAYVQAQRGRTGGA